LHCRDGLAGFGIVVRGRGDCSPGTELIPKQASVRLGRKDENGVARVGVQGGRA
jgi:hypothetical protein